MRTIIKPLVLVAGVGCHPPIGQLTARASFDMSCPQQRLTVTDLGERTKGVSGCGKRATYVFHQIGEDANHGDWVMNSPTAEPSPNAQTQEGTTP